MKIEKKELDKLLKNVESIPKNFTNGFYPQIEELEEFAKENILLIPIVLYFSRDPYSENAQISEKPDYKASVDWCKNYIESVKIKEN